MPDAFDITAAAKELDLAAGQRTAVFSVTNKLDRSVRARAQIKPEGGASSSWFRILGESERALGLDATDQFVVSVELPPSAPPGPIRFTLVVQDVENPDDVWSAGQIVQVQQGGTPAAAPLPAGRGFPWWIVAVASVGTVVLSSLIAFFVARGAVPDEVGGPFLPLSGGDLAGDLVLEPGVKLACEGCIEQEALAAGAVGAEALAAGAVTADKLAAQGVTTDALASGAITADKLGVACRDGEVLKYDDEGWACASDLAGGGGPSGPAITIDRCDPNEVLVAVSETELECKKLAYECDIKYSPKLTVPGGSTDSLEDFPLVKCDAGTFAVGGWELGQIKDGHHLEASVVNRDTNTVECKLRGRRVKYDFRCAAACCRVVLQ